jgi:hypothetical protein|tara:strand:- start:394 stop:501 length:108 start_codon:yes stop_codon:yes gene_type:complete
MDVLIPLGIVAIVVLLSVKRFKPELWEKSVSRFKK